jgi:hypothetical protein
VVKPRVPILGMFAIIVTLADLLAVSSMPSTAMR